MKYRKREKEKELGEILSSVLPNHLSDFYLISAKWADLVGDLLASKTKVDSIYGNIININVENHAWLQQIQFLKKELQDKLSSLPLNKFYEMKFRVKHDSWDNYHKYNKNKLT
ncbi:MAG: DciA family protein [Pseudomonadota bacterium]